MAVFSICFPMRLLLGTGLLWQPAHSPSCVFLLFRAQFHITVLSLMSLMDVCCSKQQLHVWVFSHT